MLYYFSRNSGRRIVHTAECSYIKNVDIKHVGACGARPISCRIGALARRISIHAPRMGRDSKTAQFSCTVLRKSNSKYNATDNS